MTSSALNISRGRPQRPDEAEAAFSPDRCPVVTLEQPPFTSGSDTVTMAQLVAMVNAARNGDSAWSVLRDSCSYVSWDELDEGLIHVTLPFYVLPTAPDLEFELTASAASGAEITGGARLQLPKVHDAVFTDSQSVSLPYFFEEGSVRQMMPAFTSRGRRITVRAQLVGNTLSLSEPATTVCRLRGFVLAYQYELHFTLDKKPETTVIYRDESGNERRREEKEIWMKVAAPSLAILASWLCVTESGRGEQQTAQLTLKIPECVTAMLQLCPDTSRREPFPLPPVKTLQVYYSTCTGEVLETRVVE